MTKVFCAILLAILSLRSKKMKISYLIALMFVGSFILLLRTHQIKDQTEYMKQRDSVQIKEEKANIESEERKEYSDKIKKIPVDYCFENEESEECKKSKETKEEESLKIDHWFYLAGCKRICSNKFCGNQKIKETYDMESSDYMRFLMPSAEENIWIVGQPLFTETNPLFIVTLNHTPQKFSYNKEENTFSSVSKEDDHFKIYKTKEECENLTTVGKYIYWNFRREIKFSEQFARLNQLGIHADEDAKLSLQEAKLKGEQRLKDNTFDNSNNKRYLEYYYNN